MNFVKEKKNDLRNLYAYRGHVFTQSDRVHPIFYLLNLNSYGYLILNLNYY